MIECKEFGTNKVLAYSTKREVKQSLLASTLRDLLDERKRLKKLMKKATGPEYKNLDSKQAAIKVLCNSVYGTLGNVVFKYNSFKTNTHTIIFRYFLWCHEKQVLGQLNHHTWKNLA